MKATPLLTGWTCRHLGDTAPGRPVTLPHDAMLAEPRTALSAGGVNTGWYEGYDYEYQRTLTVPENELSDTHILEVEGVYHNAEVWLNGQKAAFRPYGSTNFAQRCAHPDSVAGACCGGNPCQDQCARHGSADG